VPWVFWIGLAVTAFPWAAVGVSWITTQGEREPLGAWGDLVTMMFFYGIPLTIIGLSLLLIGLIKAGAWPRMDD
jgi:hypothetical protein